MKLSNTKLAFLLLGIGFLGAILFWVWAFFS
ncbi:hypothetical protein HNQ41_002433 [Texcoconibacillus texcoconensis]|uniref:Uncharacterized protein n=1 Tax=Texcoconibacillus texcoconensis TaxID=1095777 RepID=A0A840QSD3_9BACI|nr:hypothetical protein [Texcoconibacillus texcoconensis]